MSSEKLFGINNLPYGIATSGQHAKPSVVSRIGNQVIFLVELARHGLLEVDDLSQQAFVKTPLNEFMSLSKPTHAHVRSSIQSALQKGIAGLPSGAVELLEDVTIHLPIFVGDFTDFSASKNHVLNAGEAVMGRREYPPAFLSYPIGYAGRSSSICVSGTPISRPNGQYRSKKTPGKIEYGPSKAMDYELEMACIIGRPTQPGTPVKAGDAGEHIFGVALLNDWSARDIQGLEMNPLGPFNGKNFGTTLSAWITPIEALQPFSIPAVQRDQPVASYLDDPQRNTYTIEVRSEVVVDGLSTTTCKTSFDTMYWTFRDMVAHHTVGGCPLRTGDILATGTISGTADGQHGCLLETTSGGQKSWTLSNGSKRVYLEDGDVVRLRAVAHKNSVESIALGECDGQLIGAPTVL